MVLNIIYNDNYPDWLKSYCFKRFCCNKFEGWYLSNLFIKAIGKGDLKPIVLLNSYDPIEEQELGVEIAYCCFCGTKFEDLELEEGDEEKIKDKIIIMDKFVAQLKLWDKTGETNTIQIDYGDYERYNKIREEIMKLIFKYHPSKKRILTIDQLDNEGDETYGK